MRSRPGGSMTVKHSRLDRRTLWLCCHSEGIRVARFRVESFRHPSLDAGSFSSVRLAAAPMQLARLYTVRARKHIRAVEAHPPRGRPPLVRVRWQLSQRTASLINGNAACNGDASLTTVAPTAGMQHHRRCRLLRQRLQRPRPGGSMTVALMTLPPYDHEALQPDRCVTLKRSRPGRLTTRKHSRLDRCTTAKHSRLERHMTVTHA